MWQRRQSVCIRWQMQVMVLTHFIAVRNQQGCRHSEVRELSSTFFTYFCLRCLQTLLLTVVLGSHLNNQQARKRSTTFRYAEKKFVEQRMRSEKHAPRNG